ncbi:MAG TPA: chaperonin GroEL [Anaerolineae bacterium]|nr:chaperonin GroEL [Anaerolineae bacterium]
MPKPAVLQNPDASASLKRGFDTLAELLALTLGPTQGMIVSEPVTGSRPELLSDAATIARRIVALPRRDEDVGAMLLRNLVWRMHLRVGDGTATTAVLAQAILDQAHRYRAAGANPMALRRGIDQAALAALDALTQMARAVEDEEDLIAVAQTITADPDLSLILGEMFDILGPDAYITIEDYVAPYLEREYQEGGRWAGRLASPYFITDPATRRAVLPACHIVLCEDTISELEDLQPLLEIIARIEPCHVAIIAHEVRGMALSTLVVNHQRNNIRALAVSLRRPETQRKADFDDLAVLTGAQILSPARGRSLRNIMAADLGTARRVEASADELIVVGDQRHAAAVRQQIATLRAQLEAQSEDEEEEVWDELRFRLARLAGHIATLKIGASTKAEREVMRQKAEKALRALPLALREGVVPGGGVAYLNCIPTVRQVEAEGDEAWGVAILARALEEPFRRIVHNAGIDAPGAVLAQARRYGDAFGYDALKGEIVQMEQAGILDAAGVLRRALQVAVSGAVMALTTEAIVLKRRPETSLEP